MNKVKYDIAWGIWAILLLSIMLLVSDTRDVRFAIIMTFAIIALVGTLILMITQVGFKKEHVYLKMAPAIIVNGYMIVESIISVVLVIIIQHISIKNILVINIIVLCIAGLLYIGSLGGNEHISKTEMRQKNHHKEL